MKSIIIVSGHGNYATGMKSAFELLAGPNENFKLIDFTAEDSDETLKQKFDQEIDKNLNAPILFFCDMLGGTPFKTAALIANDKDNMEVVAGGNLVSLIEVSFEEDSMPIRELAKAVVNSSINSTSVFKKVEKVEVEYIETENGI